MQLILYQLNIGFGEKISLARGYQEHKRFPDGHEDDTNDKCRSHQSTYKNVKWGKTQ